MWRALLVFSFAKATSTFQRELFLNDGSYCNDDGTTSVGQPGDFRYNSIVFSSKYQPTCDCTTLPDGDQLHCQNYCETCFDDICGVLETTERRTKGADQAQNYSLCMTYSSGYAEGKTCFAYELDDPQLLSGRDDHIQCQLKSDGVPCTWCKMFSNGCIQSNCTNIHPDARVNTCRDHNRGLVKQFKMAALVNSLPQTRNVARGACGVLDKADSPAVDDINNNLDEPDVDSVQLKPEQQSSSRVVSRLVSCISLAFSWFVLS